MDHRITTIHALEKRKKIEDHRITRKQNLEQVKSD